MTISRARAILARSHNHRSPHARTVWLCNTCDTSDFGKNMSPVREAAGRISLAHAGRIEPAATVRRAGRSRGGDSCGRSRALHGGGSRGALTNIPVVEPGGCQGDEPFTRGAHRSRLCDRLPDRKYQQARDELQASWTRTVPEPARSDRHPDRRRRCNRPNFGTSMTSHLCSEGTGRPTDSLAHQVRHRDEAPRRRGNRAAVCRRTRRRVKIRFRRAT